MMADAFFAPDVDANMRSGCTLDGVYNRSFKDVAGADLHDNCLSCFSTYFDSLYRQTT